MNNYEVSYKKIGFFKRWRKLKKLKGDGLLENGLARFFILEDNMRIEIPISNIIFKFSKERFYFVKEKMEVEAMQSKIGGRGENGRN